MPGFDPDARVDVLTFDVPETVRIGDLLPILVRLQAAQAVPVMVEYVFWRRRASGDLAPKVHKLKQVLLEPEHP